MSMGRCLGKVRRPCRAYRDSRAGFRDGRILRLLRARVRWWDRSGKRPFLRQTVESSTDSGRWGRN